LIINSHRFKHVSICVVKQRHAAKQNSTPVATLNGWNTK